MKATWYEHHFIGGGIDKNRGSRGRVHSTTPRNIEMIMMAPITSEKSFFTKVGCRNKFLVVCQASSSFGEGVLLLFPIGNIRVTIVPEEGPLVTFMLPLWSSMIDFTMENPSPVPCE
jgi:hypothetical protein